MSALILNLHTQTPELRKINKVVEALKDGAVILYPTDTGFTLGCELSNKDAIGRIRAIRKLPDNHHMTFLCSSSSNISEFAKVSNLAYRTIKSLIPGPYTFVLPASRAVPRYAQNPKRKTAGIRVPSNTLSQLLLKTLGSPIISITAKASNGTVPDVDTLLKTFTPLVDVAVNSDSYSFVGASTVVDMTTDNFVILRQGAGMGKVLEFVELEEV